MVIMHKKIRWVYLLVITLFNKAAAFSLMQFNLIYPARVYCFEDNKNLAASPSMIQVAKEFGLTDIKIPLHVEYIVWLLYTGSVNVNNIRNHSNQILTTT